MTVEVKGKVIPTRFLNIEERGTFIGAEEERKKDSWWKWKVIRAQVLKHLPEAR